MEARKGAAQIQTEERFPYVLQAEREAETEAAKRAAKSWGRRDRGLSPEEQQDARDSVFFGKRIADGIGTLLYGSVAAGGAAWLGFAYFFTQQSMLGIPNPTTHALTGLAAGLVGVAVWRSNEYLQQVLEDRFEEGIRRPFSKALGGLTVDKMAWSAILFGNLVAMNPVWFGRDRTTLIPRFLDFRKEAKKYSLDNTKQVVRDAAAFARKKFIAQISQTTSLEELNKDATDRQFDQLIDPSPTDKNAKKNQTTDFLERLERRWLAVPQLLRKPAQGMAVFGGLLAFSQAPTLLKIGVSLCNSLYSSLNSLF
jgi:hypothetical protein